MSRGKPFTKITELKGDENKNIADPSEIREKIDEHIKEILRDSNQYPNDIKFTPFLTEDNLNSNHIPNDDEEINRANQKRSKSKRWYYLTKVNPDHTTKITQQITPQEILNGTKHQQNNRAIGTDYIPQKL